MTKAICIALILLSTTCAHAEFKKVRSLVHRGMCEASAGVALPRARFIVANDEDNILRAYSTKTSAGPIRIKKGKLNKHLKLDPNDDDDKVDFEGATTLNGKAYWIGSHSRSGKGKIRQSRWQFFSTTITTSGRKIKLSVSKSSHDLLGAIATLDKVFADAIQIDVKESANLAPEDNGLNIEGLTARPDGKSMFVGLRNPLSQEKKAFLIPFENPEAVAEHGEKPVLGRPVKLDLGGRGVRSIEYSPAASAYFIIAGNNGNGGSFALYRWSGNPQEDPALVEGSAKAFDELNPEAMFIDASGKVFHILSDDGDHPIKPNKTCKEVKNKSFRSFVFTIR